MSNRRVEAVALKASIETQGVDLVGIADLRHWKCAWSYARRRANEVMR